MGRLAEQGNPATSKSILTEIALTIIFGLHHHVPYPRIVVSVVFNGADAPSFHTESTEGDIGTSLPSARIHRPSKLPCSDVALMQSRICVFHDSFKNALLRASALP
jgi:hypothetical protein